MPITTLDTLGPHDMFVLVENNRMFSMVADRIDKNDKSKGHKIRYDTDKDLIGVRPIFFTNIPDQDWEFAMRRIRTVVWLKPTTQVLVAARMKEKEVLAKYPPDKK